MAQLADPIVQTKKAPSGTWYYDYYFEPIVGNDGKIYTPFYWKEYFQGYGMKVYNIGLAYFGEKINEPNFASMGIKSFKGERIRKTSVSASPTYDQVSPINLQARGALSDYNSDLKIGYYQIRVFMDFNVDTLEASTNYDFIWSIPYAGDKTQDPDGFWNRLKNLPKPKLAFELDTSEEGGGDGDYDDEQSDTIGLPSLDFLNANSISNTKFFSCYKMTPGQLSVLSEHLWTDWRNITEAIGNSILKPLDFVVSLNMLPVNVESTAKVIKLGWFALNSVVQGGLINQQYVRVDCGSLTVKKKWGGAIDYQTDVSLFLPFIGEVTLNANEVMGATLTVIYTVDIMSGNCIASVQVVKDDLNAILYQYNGNVASNFSITSLDYSNVMAGALQLAVAVGTGAGGGAGAFASAVSSTSNLLSGADVRRAGNLSATSGFMGIKKPYLILSRPIQSMPSDYNTFRGYVSNITLALSECSGYTKVAEIHLESIPATSAELDELETILKAGVIF